MSHSLVISQNLITGHPKRSIKEQAQNLLRVLCETGEGNDLSSFATDFYE